jgi:hypothetical protein
MSHASSKRIGPCFPAVSEFVLSVTGAPFSWVKNLSSIYDEFICDTYERLTNELIGWFKKEELTFRIL